MHLQKNQPGMRLEHLGGEMLIKHKSALDFGDGLRHSFCRLSTVDIYLTN